MQVPERKKNETLRTQALISGLVLDSVVITTFVGGLSLSAQDFAPARQGQGLEQDRAKRLGFEKALDSKQGVEVD